MTEKKPLEELYDVCFDCGAKYGTRSEYPIGIRIAECDICGKQKECAAPRDFDWLPRYNDLSSNSNDA